MKATAAITAIAGCGIECCEAGFLHRSLHSCLTTCESWMVRSWYIVTLFFSGRFSFPLHLADPILLIVLCHLYYTIMCHLMALKDFSCYHMFSCPISSQIDDGCCPRCLWPKQMNHLSMLLTISMAKPVWNGFNLNRLQYRIAVWAFRTLEIASNSTMVQNTDITSLWL